MSKILKATLWVLIGYGLSQVFRLLGNLILTRLLVPEMFGIMAIANLVVTAGSMLTDVGLGQSIIQHKQGATKDFLSTIWTIQLIRGLLVWVIICCIAATIWFLSNIDIFDSASVYAKPELPIILVITGLGTVISGFYSPSLYTLNRELSLGKITVTNLLSQIIGLCVTVSWAWVHRDIWALIAGSLTANCITLLLSFRIVKLDFDCFKYNYEYAKDIFKFGKWIFLSSVIGFIANQGDQFILGYYLSSKALGVYSIAFMISSVPISIVSMVSHKVIYPVLCNVKLTKIEDLKSILKREKTRLYIYVLPLALLLMLLSENIISFLYDERYHDAGWIMRILTIKVATSALLIPYSIALMAIGFPKYSSIAAVIKTFLLFSALPFAYKHGGEHLMFLIIALSDLLGLPVFFYGLKQHKLMAWKLDFIALTIFILGIYMMTLLGDCFVKISASCG